MELHPDDKLERETNLRKQAIFTVQDGMKGDYWRLLRSKLEIWIAGAEATRAKLFDEGVTDKNLRLIHEQKARMEAFAQVLRINEAIIYENRTWVERAEKSIKSAVEYVSTFVGLGKNGEKHA